MKKRILLVEPEFPIPTKSKNHKNFLPIGLLKIASYLKKNNTKVKLIRGTPGLLEIGNIKRFKPDEIWITSLFTYWAIYVRQAVLCYKKIFPKTKVVVGGIYASLMPDHCKEYTGCDKVRVGVIAEAERCFPSYDLITNTNPHPIDYQIIHTSRGCNRKCKFCGVWKIEPSFKFKKSIKEEIKYRNIVFYDNNILDNENIENILRELISLKKTKEILWCESQSGFDGRILIKKPFLAKMIKDAGFRYPRIAWDWGYGQWKQIKKQIDLFIAAGYASEDIYVFVIYNWNIPFVEMEKKRKKCWKWKVQIADCRYRPLTQTYDNYNPRIKSQTIKEYYIHKSPRWTDGLVRQFRRNVRMQNICVRQGVSFYSKTFEKKIFGKRIQRKSNNIENIADKIKYFESKGIDYWFPDIRRSTLNKLSR